MPDPVILNHMQSYKRDLAEPCYILRENNLVSRVEQARALGMSYGNYMAQLHEGRIADPLEGEL